MSVYLGAVFGFFCFVFCICTEGLFLSLDSCIKPGAELLLKGLHCSLASKHSSSPFPAIPLEAVDSQGSGTTRCACAGGGSGEVSKQRTASCPEPRVLGHAVPAVGTAQRQGANFALPPPGQSCL